MPKYQPEALMQPGLPRSPLKRLMMSGSSGGRSFSVPASVPRSASVNAEWYQVSAIAPSGAGRSEEHTSELQSLMRISYAVFCLKKKTHITQNKTVYRQQ